MLQTLLMLKYQKTSMPRIGQVVHKVTTPFYKARGFAQGRIVTDWEKIVGSQLAQYGFPERVTFPFKQKTGGTVHVVASGSGSMIFEHQSQMIIEQINTYFGYNAIAKIRYRIDYIEQKKPAPKIHKAQPLPQDEKWLEGQLSDLEDSSLKQALLNLGREILQKEQQSGDSD